MAERGRVPEPGPFRYHVHRLVGFLQQLLGEQDALPGQPALRRRAGLLDEPPRERPRRHGRQARQLIDRHGRSRLRCIHSMTSLSVSHAGSATGRSTYCAWPPSRCGGTTIRRAIALATRLPCSLRTQVQAGVDAGRRARAGDHRIVLDVEHGRIDLGRRVHPGQPLGVPPVRGAAPPVQQSRPRRARTLRCRRSAPGYPGRRRGAARRAAGQASRPAGTGHRRGRRSAIRSAVSSRSSPNGV